MVCVTGHSTSLAPTSCVNSKRNGREPGCSSGRPTHSRGVTALPGLYFLGLPWLHTWGSGRFLGIAADAEHVTGVITGRSGGARTEPAADLARRRSPGEIASDVALAG